MCHSKGDLLKEHGDPDFEVNWGGKSQLDFRRVVHPFGFLVGRHVATRTPNSDPEAQVE